MRAADVMTRAVMTATPTMPLMDAVRMMLDYRVSGLPVVNEAGDLVGMLTEGDLLHRAEAGTEDRHTSRFAAFLLGPGKTAADYVHAHSRVVGDLMTRKVFSAGPEDGLDRVVRIMEAHRVRRVPIVEKHKLLGIVSRSDLVRVVMRRLAEAKAIPATGDDTAIADRVRAEIRRGDWLAADNISIVVHDGKVTLDGTIFDERMRAALRVAAQNTPGVREVDDKLVTLDSMTALYYPVP